MIDGNQNNIAACCVTFSFEDFARIQNKTIVFNILKSCPNIHHIKYVVILYLDVYSYTTI